MKNFYSFKRFFILSIMSISLVTAYSQGTNNKDFIKAVQKADDFYFYDENYEKAASLYEPLFQIYPENNNLAAKLGICYLNLDNKKADALRLLKKASENVVNKDKEYVKTGVKAPLDTYLYLGIAYHRNDSLDKAVLLYNTVKQKLSGTDAAKENFIDLQIRNCKYAMEMKKKPLRVLSDLFASWLEDYPGACNPVLSKNDSVFVFTVKNNGITQIFCSFKKETWERPTNITKQLGGFNRFYSNSITGDGRTLILFMDDGDDGNLYYSHRNDTSWTHIKSVGKYVNSIYWESFGFITPDGNTMYFSSNRPGGEGELDVWTSRKIHDGSWERPVNCGNIINTPYDENTPYFNQDENALLFSSVGHISMGDYDVFRSTLRNGTWTTPVGMPYAFNNVQENAGFILNNNSPGFVASRYDNKSKERNIYAIVAVDPADEVTRAAGTVKLEDGMEINPNLSLITLKNLKTGSIVQNIPVSPDGTFSFNVIPGEYQVLISHDGYHTDTMNFSLPLYYQGSYVEISPVLVPEKVSPGDFLAIKNILFDFDSYMINTEAMPNLELLKNLMINYPELTIEIAGYTDSKGSTEYNRKLADKRAQTVIDHVTRSGGVDANRFVKKAFGESNFAAVNSNPDGTDNPEGRKYNRRVTVGVVDAQTGVVIRHEAYTPEHLRRPYSMRYSVVLMTSDQKLDSDYFRDIIKNETLFIRTIKTDTMYFYTLGVFYNKPDAIAYLGYAREKGMKDAYIANQYDLDDMAGLIINPVPENKMSLTRKVLTIQLKATKTPINVKRVFPGYENVRIVASDGFYKYMYGEYTSVVDAKKTLTTVQKDYEDAFIREIEIQVSNK